MSLSDIARVLRRRWWVLVAVLALTVVALVLTVVSLKSQYEATAALHLAQPELRASETESSNHRDAVTLSPLVVTEIVEGDSTREKLGYATGTTDYSVALIGEGVLQVEATSAEAAPVVPAANAVLDEIERLIADANAQDSLTRMSIEILSRPSVVRERPVPLDDDMVTGEEGEQPQIEYYATGSVLLAVDEVETVTPRNPYTASSGTLRVMLEVADAEAVRDAILDEFDDDEADYEFVFTAGDEAPIVYVVATARSSQDAMDTLEAVVALLDEELRSRQVEAGADESTHIWYQRLSYPDEAEPVAGSLRRPIATVLVLGIVAAISLAVLADSIIGYLALRKGDGGEGFDEVVARVQVPQESDDERTQLDQIR